MNKKATHNIELNFYYMHYNDAKELIELTKKEKSKLKSLYARHAILSVVFASEALINRVLTDFYIPKSGSECIDKLSTKDKWFIAPLTCAKNQKMKTFDKSKDPFQSFIELIKIRHWFVHPKANEYVEGTTEGWEITLLETGEDVPWVETIKGKAWPQTKIPVNPFELTETHAQKALDIFEKMKEELKRLLPQKITDKWLDKINFLCKSTKQATRLTIDSLWGGYTPE